MAVIARPLRVTSSKAAGSNTSGWTAGISSPVRIMSRTWVSRRRPNAPPGCERAKSSSRKPRASSRATASASPRAKVAVVLAVGARLRGQASLATAIFKCTWANSASEDSGLPVMEIRVAPSLLITGTMANNSSDSPEFEMAIKTSDSVTMPRSPCAASAG